MKHKHKPGHLKFGFGNAKLSALIATFSLPAGYSCPFAHECLSKASVKNGIIKDGPHTRFRCFAASQESTYPNVRNMRWFNYDLLRKAKTMPAMGQLIHDSLPAKIGFVRVHVSGDFWSESYFLAWLNVAWNNPLITFYGYTKATPYLVSYKNKIPPNFRFTASKGGTRDNLIAKHDLKYAEVVFSVNEAKEKNLEIDHDDSHAIGSPDSFALLLHGTQPPGTPASKAWTTLIRNGIGGYGTATSSRNMNHYTSPFRVRVNVFPSKVKA